MYSVHVVNCVKRRGARKENGVIHIIRTCVLLYVIIPHKQIKHEIGAANENKRITERKNEKDIELCSPPRYSDAAEAAPDKEYKYLSI